MIADPYPPDLASLDELPVGATSVTEADRLIRAVNRLAQAVEQNTLALLDQRPGINDHQPFVSPQPAQNAPLAALPPVQPIIPPQGVCPDHGTPWVVRPAGISKRTGQPYTAFAVCPTAGCERRPPR